MMDSQKTSSTGPTGPVSYEIILTFALRSLGRVRLSEKQLRTKIVTRFTKNGEIVQEDIDRVISRMKEDKYIDDHELAAIFVRDTMARRPHGRLWISQQLMQKGVSRDVISDVLMAHQEESRANVAAGGSDDELEAARAAAEKKLRLLSGKALEPRKQYEKMFRFLVGRGFDTSMVIKVLDETIRKLN